MFSKPEKPKKIMCVDKSGNKQTFDSINKAANYFCISSGNICDVLDRANRSCLGYKWISVKEGV